MLTKEIKSDKYAFLGLFFAVLISVYIYANNYTVFIVVRPRFSNTLENQTGSADFNRRLDDISKKSYQDEVKHGQEDWCRVHDNLFDWKNKASICEGATSWKSKRDLDKEAHKHKTAANLSFIQYIDIRKRGFSSKLLIRSVSVKGEWKKIGGDLWRVKVKGPSSPPTTILDNNDGTYEIIFFPGKSGVHHVYIYLDYTMCNGMVDPPIDWFVRGNSHGKYQKLSVSGPSHDFLNEPLGNGSPFVAYIEEDDINLKKEENNKHDIKYATESCHTECQFLWNSYGTWMGNQWVPAKEAETDENQATPIKPSGRLLLYGDSVTVFMYHSIRRNREICGKLFTSCHYVYNWIYRVYNVTRAKSEVDSFDFNATRIIEELEQTLNRKEINTENSAVILNFGLHFAESTNFSNYRDLIDGIVHLVTQKDENGTQYFKPKILWKTTTAINKERASMPQLHHRRFLTLQRVQLFNTYANAAMCRANIPIIDVYGISDSYPHGTGTHSSRNPVKNDVVHYHNEVFYPVENFLIQYFRLLKTMDIQARTDTT